MLETILMLIALAVTVLLVIASLKPSDFRITRNLLISAPAAEIFTQVNDLQHWEAWSPWAKLDPQAKNAFEGPKSGVGAIMRWAGNNKVGVGSMTIIESQPYDLIRFRLEFLKPFTATNTAEFTFTSESGQTLVTWSMLGKNNYINKVVGLFMNCDKMVGDQFEQGLAAIQSIVEAKA